MSDLSINWLSARCVCQAGLKGYFSATEMYFKYKHEKKNIITAIINNGLYIITYIAEGYKNTVFTEVILNKTASVNINIQNTVKYNKPELTLNKKKYYFFIY